MPEEELPGGSFEACVGVFEDDGHDESEAEDICGALLQESKSEHGDPSELKDALESGGGLIADVGVDLVSGVDVPAIDSKWVMLKSESDGHDFQVTSPIVVSKADREEQRISYAAAMIPREPDREGDVVATPTVEKAAHNFLTDDGGVDTDHSLIDGDGDVVESWVLKEERTFELPDGGEETYPAGTWMVGIKWAADPWERIKNGELTGLSIYGMAEKLDLDKGLGVTKSADRDTGEVSQSGENVGDSPQEGETTNRTGSQTTNQEQQMSENPDNPDPEVDGDDPTDADDGDGGDDGITLKDVADDVASLSDTVESLKSDLESGGEPDTEGGTETEEKSEEPEGESEPEGKADDVENIVDEFADRIANTEDTDIEDPAEAREALKEALRGGKADDDDGMDGEDDGDDEDDEDDEDDDVPDEFKDADGEGGDDAGGEETEKSETTKWDKGYGGEGTREQTIKSKNSGDSGGSDNLSYRSLAENEGDL